ncbi:MAG: ABC transporter ATP-binding protein [Oscillospiraceae bacterium]|nr:ABC transporter ATP-binding protein [Oscillospiraceae bacterium]
MLKAEGIVKVYSGAIGHNTVLDGLDFEGYSGEFCIITGKSGCGKSTFLNVLSCLDGFDGGKLEICGKDVSKLSHSGICRMRRNDTAFIFQGYNLISNLTAQQNVELALKYKKVKKDRRAALARQALEQVGLADRCNYLPNQLSGGQQQRVAIARATAVQPKILFCDEPTGNLDKDSAQLVLQKILTLKQKGTLVIMITHDNSLLPLADRVLRLEDGRLIEKNEFKQIESEQSKI